MLKQYPAIEASQEDHTGPMQDLVSMSR